MFVFLRAERERLSRINLNASVCLTSRYTNDNYIIIKIKHSNGDTRSLSEYVYVFMFMMVSNALKVFRLEDYHCLTILLIEVINRYNVSYIRYEFKGSPLSIIIV